MIIQEGIDGVSKSGEFSNRKPVDRAKNTIRQKCQSSVRGANIAQQNVLMCETHRSLLRWQFATCWHRLLSLPRIIAAIVDGTAPADLTVTGLAKAQPHSSNPIVPPPPSVGKGRLRYPTPNLAHPSIHFILRTSIPGNAFPSTHSRKAPPAVET